MHKTIVFDNCLIQFDWSILHSTEAAIDIDIFISINFTINALIYHFSSIKTSFFPIIIKEVLLLDISAYQKSISIKIRR